MNLWFWEPLCDVFFSFFMFMSAVNTVQLVSKFSSLCFSHHLTFSWPSLNFFSQVTSIIFQMSVYSPQNKCIPCFFWSLLYHIFSFLFLQAALSKFEQQGYGLIYAKPLCHCHLCHLLCDRSRLHKIFNIIFFCSVLLIRIIKYLVQGILFVHITAVLFVMFVIDSDIIPSFLGDLGQGKNFLLDSCSFCTNNHIFGCTQTV